MSRENCLFIQIFIPFQYRKCAVAHLPPRFFNIHSETAVYKIRCYFATAFSRSAAVEAVSVFCFLSKKEVKFTINKSA